MRKPAPPSTEGRRIVGDAPRLNIPVPPELIADIDTCRFEHRRSIAGKTSVPSRAETVRFLLRRGIQAVAEDAGAAAGC